MKSAWRSARERSPTYANPREARTSAGMYEVARLAVDANVDSVQFYPMDGGHGMRPTYAEQEAYYRDLLDAIDHPVSISVHPAVGYTTPIPLLKRSATTTPRSTPSTSWSRTWVIL